MDVLRPPVELAFEENKKLRYYMLEYASKSDFDYPEVIFVINVF